MAECSLAVDVGGTFTDLVMIWGNQVMVKKVLSTPPDFSEGMISALNTLLAEHGLRGEQVTTFVHATTVGTNAVATSSGALTGLLTTKGFGDILEIGRMSLPIQNDLTWKKRKPLVERWLVKEIDERIGTDGQVIRPLDLEAAMESIEQLMAQEVQSIAVSFINSYANPIHEHQVKDMLRREFPHLNVSISFEVNPEIMEYERTSSTVIDAYVKPVFDQYLRVLERRLEELGYRGLVFLMQANGGVMTSEIARTRPSHVLESGPVAGVIGVQKGAERTGGRNFISYDMGGTTAKCAIVENLKPDFSDRVEIDGGPEGNRFLPGAGYLLRVPGIEVLEIGSGGGSIAWIDKGGVLQVGPESAGADPGPVCYDRGGTQITQTDANVLLGYFNPEYLVGGDLRLNTEKAAEIMRKAIAQPLGLSVEEAAYGIYRLANAKMTRMVKAVTTEKGRNPVDYILVTFGGCGPGHAVAIAQELGINQVLVPPFAGLFSSFGLHFADIEQHRTWTYWSRIDHLDFDRINTWLRQMEEETVALMLRQGVRRADVKVLRFADMRYSGQGSELSITIPAKVIDAETVESLNEKFNRRHKRTYGYRSDEPVELFRLRLITKGRAKMFALNGLSQLKPIKGLAVKPESRCAYFGPDYGWIETPVIGRGDLSENPMHGPYIVEEYDSTTVVPPNWDASLDQWGNIVIEYARRSRSVGKKR